MLVMTFNHEFARNRDKTGWQWSMDDVGYCFSNKAADELLAHGLISENCNGILDITRDGKAYLFQANRFPTMLYPRRLRYNCKVTDPEVISAMKVIQIKPELRKFVG